MSDHNTKLGSPGSSPTPLPTTIPGATVSPIKPEHQTTPAWHPDISPSDSDYADEEAALPAYNAIFGDGPPTPSTTGPSSPYSYPQLTIPQLTMAYTTAPDLIPVAEGRSQAPGSPPAVTAKPFSVQLGSLRSAEQTFLTATNATVEDYQTLYKAVQNAINSPSMFGQIVGGASIPDGLTPQANPADPSASAPSGNMQGDSGSAVTYDPLDGEGQQFAASITPQLELLMRAAAGATEAMGSFTAMLNNAAQMYTDGDAQSAFPAPDGTPQAPQAPPPPSWPGFTPIPKKSQPPSSS